MEREYDSLHSNCTFAPTELLKDRKAEDEVDLLAEDQSARQSRCKWMSDIYPDDTVDNRKIERAHVSTLKRVADALIKRLSSGAYSKHRKVRPNLEEWKRVLSSLYLRARHDIKLPSIIISKIEFDVAKMGLRMVIGQEDSERRVYR